MSLHQVRQIDLDAVIELARECEQIADTDEEYELASRTVPALIAEVRYWRRYVNNAAAAGPHMTSGGP